YTVLYVQGLGEDRLRYSLDLHRERIGLVQWMDLAFELVKLWRPTMVWVEEFGASGHFDVLKREMDHRSFRFPLRKLPAIKRSKVDRIKLLQPVQQRGEILWPREGFGHGSREDRRDTFDQFRSDE